MPDQWEYQVLTVGRGAVSGTVQDMLDEWGANGWELVGVHSESWTQEGDSTRVGRFWLLLKRPKRP
jgi:hypothetical protein